MPRPFALTRLGVIMRPDPAQPAQACGTLNPAVTRSRDGALYAYPRVVAANDYSRIGQGRVRFDEAGDPAGIDWLGYALEPWAPYELRPEDESGGCEDPRVTYLRPLDLYVMAYVARGPDGAHIALAVADDALSWRRLGLVNFEPIPDPVYGVDFDSYRDKDGMFFPDAVTGPDGRASLAMLHRPMYGKDDLPRDVTDPRHGIWISYCALDDARDDASGLCRLRHHHLLADPEYEWEDLWIGGGAPPVRTPLGWLVIYHGVKERAPRSPGESKPVVYSAGALVLDADDPRKVLYRSPEAILTPETPDEIDGVAPDAVFPTGIDDRGDGRIDVYYGMADTRIGVARLQVPDRLP